MGQPEEHQDLIGYEGEQRSSYREIPEDFQLYPCLLLNSMKKRFNQKLPITKRTPFLKNLPKTRIFSTGEEKKLNLFGCTHPRNRQRFPISIHTSSSPLISTGTQGANSTAYLEHGRHQPTPQTPTALKNPSYYLPKHKAVQRDPHGPDIQSLQSEESTVKSTTRLLFVQG